MPNGTVKDVRPPSHFTYFIKALHIVVNVIHLILNTFINSFLLNRRQIGVLIEDGKEGKRRNFRYNGPKKLCIESRVSFTDQPGSNEVEIIDKISNDNC